MIIAILFGQRTGIQILVSPLLAVTMKQITYVQAVAVILQDIGGQTFMSKEFYMNVLAVTLFAIFGMNYSSITYAESSPVTSPQKVVTCTAKDVYPPSTSSLITIKISAGENPLVQSIGRSNPALKFKFGQGYVAGRKADLEKHDYHGEKCTPTLKYDSSSYFFEYNCDLFIIDTDGAQRTTSTLTSRLVLETNGESMICKTLGDGASLCWELSNCK
jgi:hypothetical protein